MSPEQWDRIEAKREQNRYFDRLEREAFESQLKPTKAKKPAKVRKSWQDCIECSRPMRPRTASAEENPERVVYGARGRCSGCSRDRGPSRPEAPKACVDCHRPMRRRGTLEEDFPGTVAHFSGGRCRRCYAVAHPAPRKTERRVTGLNTGTLQCLQCSVHLRGQSQTAADFPFETRRPGRHEADGYVCTSCVTGAAALHDWPRPCVDCGVPLVSRTMDPAPGQKRHAGKGRCGACKTREYRRSAEVG